MKSSLFALLLASANCFAQTNPVSLLRTNWITAAPNFREVDGKLYNVEKSQLWEHHHCWLTGTNSEGISFTEIIKVVDHMVRSDHFIPYSPQYHAVYKDGDGKVFIVKNFPVGTWATKDEFDFEAMRVGSVTMKDGSILELWDYGTPHRVAVISTNTPRNKVTNQPKK